MESDLNPNMKYLKYFAELESSVMPVQALMNGLFEGYLRILLCSNPLTIAYDPFFTR